MKNLAKITITVISTLLVVSVVLIFVIAHFTLVFVLDTKVNGRIFPSEIQSSAPLMSHSAKQREWMLLTAKQRQILSQDNLILNAYFIAAPEATDC